MWYERGPKDGKMGTIYWNDIGKKKKKSEKSIPVDSITGLFEQNQTDAFRKHRKSLGADRTARCFSIVGSKRTLDLEARSKDVSESFLAAIHRLLSGSGFGVREVSRLDKDELLMQDATPLVQNTFVIKARLRNLPTMPWSKDDTNHTLIVMAEKKDNMKVFKNIEQTEWAK